ANDRLARPRAPARGRDPHR
ncbi:MAG: hypothetical protein AVDCRST_MAG13-3800, partial [uncultured Solirubrobacteraceae bacterium]